MKYFLIFLVVLAGCFNSFEKKKSALSQDIEIIKLEIRKVRLENELRDLEKDK